MASEAIQGLIQKRTWTNAELEQVYELLEVCNAYEGLNVKLAIAMLRTRTGHETNDFLYYAGGKLVGLLALDSIGSKDKEVTAMVHPDNRRQGIATSLLAVARAEAQQRGIERFILACERFSRSGQAFVAALGAQYDYSEHKMALTALRTREDYTERLSLRHATETDIEGLAHIITACFGQTQEGARRHVAESMRDPYNRYYIGTLGDKAVGCLDLFMDDREYGIYTFGILPQYRRRGFGSQMLEQLIKDIHTNNESSERRIALEVESENRPAISLYRSCGFQEITTYGYYNLDLV
ncbi:MAG: GNAT family N-acetyltransferase [Ktedonobacteraceae bacterium]